MVDEPKDQDTKEGGTLSYEEVTSQENPKRPNAKKRMLPLNIVQKMKAEGLSKPDDVSELTWNQVEEVQPGPHTLVAHLAACGLRPSEIAEQTGYALTTVRQYLASEKIQLEIRALQHKYFGRDSMRRFQSLINEAADTLEDTMRDKQVKPSVRVMAADKILDRALGKPKQFLSVEGNLIRRVYETLDSTGRRVQTTVEVADNPNIKDVTHNASESNPNVIEKRATPNPNADQSSYVDDWVEKNIK